MTESENKVVPTPANQAKPSAKRRRRNRRGQRSDAPNTPPRSQDQQARSAAGGRQNRSENSNTKTTANQRRRGQSRRGRPLPLAAIDLGTNNCRLLVAQVVPETKAGAAKRAKAPNLRAGRLKIVDAFSRIVRLGEGLASSGRLSDEAMERTISALKICAHKVQRASPIRLEAVATEACRRAENGEAFLDRIKKETGIHLRIISGAEEAELALKSCVPLIDQAAKKAVVFDIGGGSTEVSVVETSQLNRLMQPQKGQHGATKHRGGKAKPPLLIDSVSAPVGVVTFAERIASSQDELATYAQMRAEVSAHFAELARRNDLSSLAQRGEICVIGTGGTITTLKALNLGLRSYDRSKVDATSLDRENWESVITSLSTMTPEQRAANGCIGQGRADLVLPGCAILEGMLDLWAVDKVGVADRGLREGLLVTMMAQQEAKGARRRNRQKSRRGQHGDGAHNAKSSSSMN